MKQRGREGARGELRTSPRAAMVENGMGHPVSDDDNLKQKRIKRDELDETKWTWKWKLGAVNRSFEGASQRQRRS
jgi:hypothetical protein